MLLRILCCVLALSWLPASATEIYKVRDKDGNITYTDNPPSGLGEKVVLPPINTVPAEELVHPDDLIRRAPAQDQSYAIQIMSPRNNVMISPEQRDLAIAVNLNQALKDDHWLVYYMDDQLLEETKSTSIIVREVPRGGRTIYVEVIAANGNTLAQSESVTVNVMRPTVKPKAAPVPGPKP